MKPTGRSRSSLKPRSGITTVSCPFRFDGFWFAVREQRDRAALLEIDQDSPVGVAFAERPIVDTQDSWCGKRGQGVRADETEQGASTDRHTAPVRQTRAASTTDHEAQVPLIRRQPKGTPPPRSDQGGHTFTEDLLPALGVLAAKFPCVKGEVHGPVGPWEIHDSTLIPAMQMF